MLKSLLRRIDGRSGLREFLESLSEPQRLLDVGCAGGSPSRIKGILPSVEYYGIDILETHEFSGEKHLFSQYFAASPEKFADEIRQIDNLEFDVIISSHNLEHCLEPLDVLGAMVDKLSVGGYLYISTPCVESIAFPSRVGTLNFYDDSTHTSQPIDSDKAIRFLSESGFNIKRVIKRHRPRLSFLRGLLNEWYSHNEKRTYPGTWELYGFETIIWAEKNGR